MRKQIITEIWAKRHGGLLGAFYVYCFWGDPRHLNRFLQVYAVEKCRLESRRHGHSCVEQVLEDGSIKLTIAVGGAA